MPLLAATCGKEEPQPAPATPMTYTVRYSISGIGTQAYVDRPYCQISLSSCHPDYTQRTAPCPANAELLGSPIGANASVVTNVPVTTTSLNTTDNLSGRTLYLSARFYVANNNPPGPNARISAELLGNGQPVQTVVLTQADAQLTANQYPDNGPGDYSAVKFVKFTLP